jgi:hypothetical protein
MFDTKAKNMWKTAKQNLNEIQSPDATRTYSPNIK